ncbi:hypothetical protein EXU48_00145 [Occultella glacieicola]|uniref:Uncharacterized protein n=1 Tax=Occultella glacieicola TaxID=2518684 RepID=A0ABY2E833_9MICO|nr:hypothetical protein EXU48_00145 [Occultella glacieicola]
MPGPGTQRTPPPAEPSRRSAPGPHRRRGRAARGRAPTARRCRRGVGRPGAVASSGSWSCLHDGHDGLRRAPGRRPEVTRPEEVRPPYFSR